MARCHPAPYPSSARGWLLTDARLEQHGLAAARRLPPGHILLVRSDHLLRPARLQLIRQLRRIARARRIILFLAGVTPDTARRLGADGVHLRNRSAPRAAQARRLGLATSAPVHNLAEARAVWRGAIDHALISPVYPTQSHPGAKPLGIRRFLMLARAAAASPVALGGMDAARHRMLIRRTAALGRINGWAAIDAWKAGRRPHAG